MKDLIEDIRKKEFQKVYLLCGEEPYLRQLYKKKLTEAVLPEGDTMNLLYGEKMWTRRQSSTRRRPCPSLQISG